MMISKLDPASGGAALPIVESPTHEEIAERAYGLFQSRGGAAGQDLDDWLQAERELLHERSRQVNAIDLTEVDQYRPLAEPAWP